MHGAEHDHRPVPQVPGVGDQADGAGRARAQCPTDDAVGRFGGQEREGGHHREEGGGSRVAGGVVDHDHGDDEDRHADGGQPSSGLGRQWPTGSRLRRRRERDHRHRQERPGAELPGPRQCRIEPERGAVPGEAQRRQERGGREPGGGADPHGAAARATGVDEQSEEEEQHRPEEVELFLHRQRPGVQERVGLDVGAEVAADLPREQMVRPVGERGEGALGAGPPFEG